MSSDDPWKALRETRLPRGPFLAYWSAVQHGRLNAAKATPYGATRKLPHLAAVPSLRDARDWLYSLAQGSPLEEEDPTMLEDLGAAKRYLHASWGMESCTVRDVLLASPRIHVLYGDKVPPTTEELTAYSNAIRDGGVRSLFACACLPCRIPA